MRSKQDLSRRSFLSRSAGAASAAGAAAHVVGFHTSSQRLSAAPTAAGQVRMVAVGIGGRGNQNINGMTKSGLAKFVGLCDVDQSSETAKETLDAHPNAKVYSDFRKMFDDLETEFDAVVISTPDHSHLPIVIDAMRRGKHVYCEKPLAHSFREIDLILAAADKFDVVTQMGNQGHSSMNFYQALAMSKAGYFDNVTRVIGNCNIGRPKGYWGDNITGFRDEPKPPGLDWDSWIGPREAVPFSETLHPGRWRFWYRFGSGLLGDWGAHTFDTAHQFMDLGLPESVELINRGKPNRWVYPDRVTLKMNFPARGERPPVELMWYQGDGNIPEEGLREGEGKYRQFAKVLFNDELRMAGSSHESPLFASTRDGRPYDLPEYEMADDAVEEYAYYWDSGRHHVNFLRACQSDSETTSPFTIGGPLVQMLHVGQVAIRYGGRFDFDRDNRRFTGDRSELANGMLQGPEIPSDWREYFEEV